MPNLNCEAKYSFIYTYEVIRPCLHRHKKIIKYFLKITTSFHGKSVIFSTSYRLTENQFGHTALGCNSMLIRVAEQLVTHASVERTLEVGSGGPRG